MPSVQSSSSSGGSVQRPFEHAKKNPPHPTAGGQKIDVATAGNHRPGDFVKGVKPQGVSPGPHAPKIGLKDDLQAARAHLD